MLWGTFSVCLAVMVLVVTLLGARHPRKPKWACDAMVQYVWVIVVLGLAATGLSLFVFAFSNDAAPVTTQEYLIGLAFVAGTAVVIKLLGIKKKLVAYATGRQAA